MFSITQECVVPFLDLFELLCVKKKLKPYKPLYKTNILLMIHIFGQINKKHLHLLLSINNRVIYLF